MTGATAVRRPVPAPAIHVQGLEKSYGKNHVLRGVDFDVELGSVFALLGSNGAGKTTAVLADELLERFSLTDAGGRRAAEYSGGMRRRLDIAMSLIGNPPVLFLDEPTTGLDPEARLEVWKAIRELAQNGTTVLLATQYLDEAEQLADRIAILHHGRIIANGTLAELKLLLPPATVEYVEKQPTLEEIFLALISSPDQREADDRGNGRPVARESAGDLS